MIASQTLRLGGTVALIALLALTATGAVDRRAQESSGAVFRRALITFAAARTLDGAISLAQGTEIALQPAGMGVTVSAGELLDPVNDLVEQFSSLMLIATTSLGLQNMLLRVSQWWVLGALLGLLTIARVALLWYPKVLDEPLRQLIAGAFVVALIVRFAVPLYALGSGLFFEHFLAPTQSEAVGAIEQASGDIRERIEAFRERLATVTEQLLHLVVVFTLQTIALPLAFLWLLPRVVSWTMRRLG